MIKLNGNPPDVLSWYHALSDEYDISEIVFFGDFSGSLKSELAKIRTVTNSVIDTQNAGTHYKKDFTDFLMLDYIYRKSVERKKPDVYILFTGDGHFSSVVTYLRTKCKRDVVIYGVEGATSRLLKNAATSFREFPTAEEKRGYCIKAILENLYSHTRAKNKRLTFKATVDNVSKRSALDAALISEALEYLIKQGYISRRPLYINRSNRIFILITDWDALIRDGLWTAK